MFEPTDPDIIGACETFISQWVDDLICVFPCNALLVRSSRFYSVATYSARGAAGKIKNDMAADNTDSSDDDSMRSAVTAIAV